MILPKIALIPLSEAALRLTSRKLGRAREQRWLGCGSNNLVELVKLLEEESLNLCECEKDLWRNPIGADVEIC
jgi:hypothetical protein